MNKDKYIKFKAMGIDAKIALWNEFSVGEKYGETIKKCGDVYYIDSEYFDTKWTWTRSQKRIDALLNATSKKVTEFFEYYL